MSYALVAGPYTPLIHIRCDGGDVGFSPALTLCEGGRAGIAPYAWTPDVTAKATWEKACPACFAALAWENYQARGGLT